MAINERLAAVLKLSAGASEDTILEATKKLVTERDAQVAQQVEAEVSAVMLSHGVAGFLKPALLLQRTADPAGFAAQFPAKTPPFASGSSTLSQPGGSDPFGSMRVSQDGSIRLGGPTASPNGQPTINLSTVPGRNQTERAMNYLKAQPGGAELAHDDLWAQAVSMVRNGQARDSRV